MHLEATVLLTVTIAGGSRLSTVTNGIFAFGFYALAFIGGWIEQAGVMMNNASARYAGTAISLVSPADAIWRLAMYVMSAADHVAGADVAVFHCVGAERGDGVVGGGVCGVVLRLAVRGFQRRAL